jgi:hypothetical protein
MKLPDESMPGAFLDDPVVKFEYRAARTRQTLDGERALMFAVLADALDTYAKTRTARSFRQRAEHREVRSWIQSDSTATPFTFENICDSLRINPDALRTYVKSPQFFERNTTRRFRHIAADRDMEIQLFQKAG